MRYRGVPDASRCRKFKKSDFALFSSLWWPDAAWDDLYTAMLFTVALFVWDDTIDTNEHMLAADFEKAEMWREQSLDYFRYHLRLSPGQDEPCCPDEICLLFGEFAQRFCEKFGHGSFAHRGVVVNFFADPCQKLEYPWERIAG